MATHKWRMTQRNPSGKSVVTCTGTVTGTVKSGHPLDTTLFNTIRSLLYAKMIAYEAGVPYSACAAGDDLVIFVHKNDGKTLLRAAE